MAGRPSRAVARGTSRAAALGAAALTIGTLLTSVALASSGPAVTVKVRAPNKTLLAPTKTHGGKGWITKGGTPKGKCPAASAAGALTNATQNHWKGKYYSSVGGIFITSILGYTPKGHHFWELFVNGKVAQKGVCDIKLHPGERLLFKVVQ